MSENPDSPLHLRLATRVNLGGGNYAELRPDLYEVDRLPIETPTDANSPRCAVCGGPTAAGAGCEFCPKVLP